MRYGCPNTNCNYFKKKQFIVPNGSYFRKNDSRTIRRYKCKFCGKRFSNATFSLAFGQNKRRVNIKLFRLFASGNSIRGAALIENINKKTAARKLKYLAKKARLDNAAFLKKIQNEQITHLQIDDLITTEHTKLKPLSVTVAVDADRRFILDAQVSQIPAFGKLAALSRRKYGNRKSSHQEGLKRVFENIQPIVDGNAIIKTDEHNLYPKFIKKYFSQATHQQYKSKPASIVGQGELKKGGFDPLYTINHTLAMMRARINRLFRRTWNTTKDPARLKDHIDIFISYYNSVLLA